MAAAKKQADEVKEISRISDLVPDQNNANRGTRRGKYMVNASLADAGAGRSIVVDRDGRIIAGNKTAEEWEAMAADEDVVVVQTDGKKLVVVQRTDLDLEDDPKGRARRLAYFDNRASEVGLEWDPAILEADLAAGLDLSVMFSEDELDGIALAAEYEAVEFLAKKEAKEKPSKSFRVVVEDAAYFDRAVDAVTELLLERSELSASVKA